MNDIYTKLRPLLDKYNLFERLGDEDYGSLYVDLEALIADEVKKARLVAVISEWEQIDGEDTYYWDYRENGKTTEKVYLTPIERNDELELQLAELQSTLGDKYDRTDS